MAQYAVYRYNYDFIGSGESPEYERSYQKVIHEIFENEADAKKAIIALEREGISNKDLCSRKEWYELTQEQVLALKEFVESCGLTAPIDKHDDQLEFKVWEFNTSNLNDEQLLTFLELGNDGMYQISILSESYEQKVVYTASHGYLREDPNGYSENFVNISRFSELEELVSNYSLYWGEEIELDSIELTASDIASPEFIALTKEYDGTVEINISEDEQSGNLIFLKDADSYCMKDFNDVVDNPSFMIHDATNLDLMQINQDTYTLLEKYKHSGRK